MSEKCYKCEDDYFSLADKIYIREYGICYTCDNDPEADRQFERCIRIACEKLNMKDFDDDN